MLCLCIALVAWLRRGISFGIALPLGLYGLVSFFWMAGQAFWRLGWLAFLQNHFLAEVQFYGLFVLGLLFLFLNEAFLQRDRWGRTGGVFGVAWIAGLIVLDVNLFRLPDVLWSGSGWFLPRQAVVAGGLVTGWATFMGAATYLSARAIRRVEPVNYRNPLSYWTLVLALIVTGDILFFLGFPTQGSALRVLGALLATYVVFTPRLPDFLTASRRLLNFLMVNSLAIMVYAALFLAVQYLFRSPTVTLQWWIPLGLAIVLIVVINPGLSRAQKEITRRIAGERPDSIHILRQYSQNITQIPDLQNLASLALRTCSEVVDSENGYLFLVERIKDGENEKISGDSSQYVYQLRGVEGMGGGSPTSGILCEDSLLVAYWSAFHSPLMQAEITSQPRFQNLLPEERTWLDSLNAEVYLPIYCKNEWAGLLALGPRLSGAAYEERHFDLLSSLADQTAVALENISLVESLLRVNNEFRRAYAALDQANSHLERLDKTKTDFISIASHELRTPLTVISGASQMLLEDPAMQADPENKQLLAKIQAGTLRLHEIVGSMLDMARIETRDFQPASQRVALKSLIESLGQDFDAALIERKLNFQIEGLDSLPPIEADLAAIRKVFYHLISNAIKFTPDGGWITVKGALLTPGDERMPKGGVEIMVRDTGIGIAPRFKELIFVKFYQTGELALHSTGKTRFKGGGPGLGLAIAKGIVEAHGGKVWAESPGYDEALCPGSEFHVLFPLRSSDAVCH